MKALQLVRFDSPQNAVELVEIDGPPAPAADEIQIAVQYSPINPSDLLMIRGFYGIRPTLPAILGSEGVGRVVAVGKQVTHLQVGDRVLVPYMVSAWQELVNVNAASLFALPEKADEQQLSMLGINPATAHLLLTEFTRLNAGDWLIQNAANSAVARAVLALAHLRGIRTINIVRSESAAQGIRSTGEDVILIDGPDLVKRISHATQKAPIKLGLDAVGGTATAQMASVLANGGVAVAYAAMSGQPAQIGPRETIFRDISLRGFWLANWARRASATQWAVMYRQLVPLISDGSINVPVTQVARPEDAKTALEIAERLQGKVLFQFSA